MMTDRLGEALAWYDEHNPNGSVDQMYPIVAAARNWHALTPLIESGVEDIEDTLGHASKWGYATGESGHALLNALLDALTVTAEPEAVRVTGENP